MRGPTQADTAAERNGRDRPMSAVTVLRAIKNFRATKTWSLQTSGEWKLQKSYGAGMHFAPATIAVTSLDELYQLLDQLRHDPAAFIVRGDLAPWVREMLAKRPDAKFRRLKTGRKPTLIEEPRPWLMADIDAFDLLPGECLITDPERPIRRAIETVLPAPFHRADMVWQLSASSWFKPDVLKVHLWYWLDRPAGSAELKHSMPGKPFVDPVTFETIQIHYTADPIIEGGEDPLPRRVGMLRGEVRAVAIDEVVPLQRDDDSQEFSGEWAGLNVEQILAVLGDGDGLKGFHEPLLRATLMYAFDCLQTGTRNDPEFIARLVAAIAAAPKSDGRDMRQYGVHSMQRYIDGAFRWWRDNATFANSPPQPTMNAAEAAETLIEPIAGFFDQAARHADWEIRWRMSGLGANGDYLYLTPAHSFAAAAVGVGKTRATLLSGGGYLRTPTPGRIVPRRIVYNVRDHALGPDIIRRFGDAGVPAQLYLGLGQTDPDFPKYTVCRQLDKANKLIEAGGNLKTLCKGCPFRAREGHKADESVCAHHRIPVIEHGLVVLAGPGALVQDPPGGFRRAVKVNGKEVRLPPADILIIDEPAPTKWTGGLGRAPYDVVIDPTPIPLFDTDTICAEATEIADAMVALRELVEQLPIGPMKRDDVRRVADLRDWGTLVILAKELRAQAEKHITPDMSDEAFDEVVERLKEHNDKVFRVRRLMRVIADADEALSCSDAPLSGSIDVVEVEAAGSKLRALRLRWREHVNDAWADTATLFLDATTTSQTLQPWFDSPVKLIADAKATEPGCVRRVQARDCEFPYDSWVPKGAQPPRDDDKSAEATAERTRWNNVRRFLRMLVVLCDRYRDEGRDGYDVLAAMPLETRKAVEWLFADEYGGSRPAGLALAHFGKLRGLDRYGGVRCYVRLGRMMALAPVYERTSGAVHGVRSSKCKGLFRRASGIYLMRDGSRRPAQFTTHPDALVSAVMWQEVDAECEQADGRPRSIWRTPDNPLDVILLCSRPQLAPVDELITKEEALADAHPARWLVACGVVPELGKRGSQEFLAAVLGNTREAVKKELAADPRWRQVIDQASTAELQPFSVWVSADQRYATPVWINAEGVEQAIARLAWVGIRVARGTQDHSENSKNSHRGGSPICRPASPDVGRQSWTLSSLDPSGSNGGALAAR
jgi:hypothetical protein